MAIRTLTQRLAARGKYPQRLTNPLFKMLERLGCRCCYKPIDYFGQEVRDEQKRLVGWDFYVHCTNPACPLYYATRRLDNWLTMDLAQWGAAQHPDWQPPIVPDWNGSARVEIQPVDTCKRCGAEPPSWYSGGENPSYCERCEREVFGEGA